MKALKVFCIFLILFLVSCSVKKRTYRDGYYIDWAFQKRTSAPVIKNVSEKHSNSPVKEVIETEYVTASKVSDPETKSFVADKGKIALIDTCGDVITFKSGDQVTARVTEITDDKIKYKRCDNLDGPVFVVNKGTVQSIRYSNGVEEAIVAPQTSNMSIPNNPYENNQNKYKGPKKMHPKSVWALLCLLIGCFVFGLGIIFAYFIPQSAIREIDAKPDFYKGRKLAKVVKSICLVLFAITAGILVLILFAILLA